MIKSKMTSCSYGVECTFSASCARGVDCKKRLHVICPHPRH
nr:MAG TPA: 50S ribosomal protein L2 [Caudoviricetes sp.]